MEEAAVRTIRTKRKSSAA